MLYQTDLVRTVGLFRALFHARGNKSFKDKNRTNFIFIILKKQRFSFPNVYFGELFVWELKPSEILDCEAANTFLPSSVSAGRERREAMAV